MVLIPKWVRHEIEVVPVYLVFPAILIPHPFIDNVLTSLSMPSPQLTAEQEAVCLEYLPLTWTSSPNRREPRISGSLHARAHPTMKQLVLALKWVRCSLEREEKDGIEC